jgi:WD40 repeat protein
VLAANALVRGGSPVARGILAGLAVAERPERVGPVATPDGCDDVLLTPDAAVALCRVGPTLSAWSTDPLARRWALELDVREIVPFSSDRAVAWLDGDALALVDLDTGAQIATFGPFLMGHGVGASADGAYLTFGAPGLFQVLDVAAGQTVPGPWQAGSVASSSFADHRIVVMMRDGRLLDGPVGGPIQAFETSFLGRSEARTVRHLPGGGWLVGTVSGQVARLDAGGKTVAQVDGFAGAVLGASVLPDGRTVVVHGGQGAPRIFDLATSAWRGRFPSGEGQRATVGRDGTVVIGPDPAWRWRVPSEVAPRAVSVGDGVTSLDVSPDGRWLAAAAGAGRALVWDLAAADPARDLWVNAKGAVIKDVVFAADGTLFTADAEGGLGAVGLPRPRGGSTAHRRVGLLRDGDRSVVWTLGYGVSSPELWDVATGAEVRAVRVPGRELFEGEPSADRAAAALLDTDGRVYVMRGGPLRIESVLTRDGATAVDVVPALGLLAVGGARRVEVVRLSDGVSVLDVDPGARVVDLALSPDGGRVAASDTAGRVRVWSVPSGALVADLRGHADRVAAVRFSPDSGTLFTADWSGQVRRWRLSVLDANPAVLRSEVEQAWGVDLEGALGRDEGVGR